MEVLLKSGKDFFLPIPQLLSVYNWFGIYGSSSGKDTTFVFKSRGYHISQAQGADSDGIESCSCHSGLSEGSLKTNPKCYRSSTK